MACGEFSEPIYKLIDELGGPEASSNLVLQELIKFLRYIKLVVIYFVIFLLFFFFWMVIRNLR